MSKQNLNHPEQSSLNRGRNRQSILKFKLNSSQTSTKKIETNQEEILNDLYPEGSPQNGQFILPNKKKTFKTTIQQTSTLQQNSTVQKSIQKANPLKPLIQVANHQPQKAKYEQLSLNKILAKSKLLKLIFEHFCNISYADSKKKTFEQMQTKNQSMSLNRFMLFCKQFNIYSIVKFQLKTQPNPNPTSISRANTFHKTSEELIEKNTSQYLSKTGKNKMLEIPVKEIMNFEKKMISIFRSCVENNQKMTYENFVNAIEQIHAIFTKNINEIYPQKSLPNEAEARNIFLSSILFVKTKESFNQKMDSLKIEFKGSINYHPENQIKRKSQKYLKKPLVIHGGRDTLQMKKQLQVYQSTKFKKTETWIGSQPQMVALYSKSRVFYKPTPAKTYETNDVIRLARREAGRMHTQSLFDVKKTKQQGQHKPALEKKPQTVTFGKIFEDKTNTFGEKLEKFKDQLVMNKQKKSVKTYTQNDDEILKKYFENEKMTYGSETFHFRPNY